MRPKLIVAAAVVVCLAASTQAFGQGGASTLGTVTGIVTDNSQARLPGVTVKIVNEDTGVANSMLTNESGDFSFLLTPGTNYKVTAEFTGFQRFEVTKLTVRSADTIRVDLSLEVGDVKVTRTVEASRNPLLQGATQDIGNLLDETQIQGLPLVGNDPLTLITTLPGYRANPLGHEFDTVGGLPMTMMNTVRDGLSVTDELFPNGVSSGTILNPDMISEIRLILAPVDAEAGRGNGQVQITTKSGTNKFQWNINYNLRQNALNALGPSPTRVKQPFGATFQYIVSVGGPIIKNRTFYFANFDHQLRFARSGGGTGANGFGGYLAVPALTDLARNGIFRWFDGWASQPQGTILTTPGANGTPNGTTNAWSVDPNDPTIVPQYWPNATTTRYDGALQCMSVFGTIKFDGSPFNPATDCGTYIPRRDDGQGLGLSSWVPDLSNPQTGIGVVPGGLDYFARKAAGMDPVFSWEAMATLPDGSQVQIQRPPDRTGYMQRLLSYMPRVNVYKSSNTAGGQVAGGGGTAGADGLNRAAHEYVRGFEGLDNRNTFRGGTFGFGTSLDQAMVGHKIINLKLDHVVDSRSRVSFSTSLQDDQNSRLLFQSRWPDGIDGFSARVPRVLTVNGITTLSPNLVNEARFGINLNRSTQLPAWDNPDQSEAEFARGFLQQGWADANCGTADASETCKPYKGISPIYFTPGSPGNPGTGYMDFADNILPASSNAGFSNSGSGQTSLQQCNGTGASTVVTTVGYNCESMGKLINIADTVSWNRGAHSIRAGAEMRFTRTREDSSAVLPNATSGPSGTSGTPLSSITAIPELPGFQTGSNGGRVLRVAQTSADLLYLLSGSVQQVSQTFWANGVDNFVDGTWETWSNGTGRKSRRSIQNEYAMFIKDDWKVSKSLTLNLGLRYENYGNLYLHGFMTGIQDGGAGLFGPTRMRGADPFQYWLTPGNLYYTGYGPTPPGIDVTGTFLPNGQPGYVPGQCTPGVASCGVAGAVGNVSPGGPGIQVVGAPNNNNWTPVVSCSYGVQQVTPFAATPQSNCDPSLLTSRIFVGPGSDHPELPATYRDRNNIGPAIGFSWRAPFLGNRTLLVRGGFQFTFGSAGRDKTVGTGSLTALGQSQAGNTINFALDQTTTSCGNTTGANPASCLVGYDPATAPSTYALTLSDLPNLIPLRDATAPPSFGGYGTIAGAAISGQRTLFIQDFNANRTRSATAYDPRYQDARTENYTFSISTNLSRNSTLAISYVGTLGKNRPTGVNINMANVYSNPELFDALSRTRAGEDVPLFDQMLAGLNLTGLTATSGYGAIGTCVTPTGGNAATLIAAKQAAFDAGMRDAGNCPRTAIYQSGSAHLRNASGFGLNNLALNLANGNFAAVATSLATGAPTTTQPWENATWSFALGGRILRTGCNRLAAATTTNRLDLISGTSASGNQDTVRCFPEDWLIANPSYDPNNGAVYKSNWGWTNYQQLQVQYTLRLSSGINLQTTYLTSKTLALPRDFYKTNSFGNNAGTGVSSGVVTGFSDPRTEETRRRDYAESSDSLKHALRLNGVFQLPFGPGKLLLGQSSGLIATVLGGWTLGVIYNAQSGQPFSINAGDMLYGVSSGVASSCNAFSGSLGITGTNCQSGLTFPDVISPLWTTPNGKIRKNGPDGSTSYYGYPSPFATITDPQCSTAVGRSVMSDPAGLTFQQCQLRALVMKVAPGTPGAFYSPEVDSTGATPALIMLQNPMPGKQGTLGAQTMRQPGRFYLDANLSKTFMFTESRGVQIRIDATNVLNHPTPADLYFSLGPGGSVNDLSNSSQSALSSGCFTGNVQVPGNAFCGRQVQFGLRMINN